MAFPDHGPYTSKTGLTETTKLHILRETDTYYEVRRAVGLEFGENDVLMSTSDSQSFIEKYLLSSFHQYFADFFKISLTCGDFRKMMKNRGEKAQMRF